MKTNIQVTELTHDELVNILSTALYGNYYLGADYNIDDYESIPEKKRNGNCFEDKMADILLNGGTIQILDLCAEDEDYDHGSKLPHEFISADEDPQERYRFDCMSYSVTLKDVLAGCSTEDGYDYAKTLLVDERGDMYTAYNLIQLVLFGEEIYC